MGFGESTGGGLRHSTGEKGTKRLVWKKRAKRRRERDWVTFSSEVRRVERGFGVGTRETKREEGKRPEKTWKLDIPKCPKKRL